MKRLLKRWLPSRVIAVLRSLRRGVKVGDHSRLSYSQEGEDLVLARMLENTGRGFFVDVGAHHPTRFSNTYLLYRKGWRGINIDATPGSMKEFEKIRPRDINLEVAISDDRSVLKLYRFNEPALNTVSGSIMESRESVLGYSMVGSVEVQAMPLVDVLRQHLPRNIPIDVLTIDVEGHDFAVLKSNDWDLYRPKIVIVELLDMNVREALASPEVGFMERHGYDVYAMLVNSVVFVDGRH